MHEGIDESEKHGVTAANVASPRPDADGQNEVMVQMKSCDLVVLFPKDEEESVEKIDELRYKKPIASVKGANGRLVRRGIVHRLAKVIVLTRQPSTHSKFPENPGIEDNLEEIVNH